MVISVAIVLDPFDFLRIVLIVIAIYTNYSIGVPRVVDIVVKKVKEIRLKLIAHIYIHTHTSLACVYFYYINYLACCTRSTKSYRGAKKIFNRLKLVQLLYCMPKNFVACMLIVGKVSS